LDVAKREVNLEVPEAILEGRRKEKRVFGAQDTAGYLGIYQRLVKPVHKGATLT
jgi:dihydroxyacid dehydratase/phosphogluconate dehydratase